MELPDWQDLISAIDARGLVLMQGRPTAEHVDLFDWDPGDINGWLDAAAALSIRAVYAEEVRAPDHVDLLRATLERVYDAYGETFEAEHDDIDLQLSELADDYGQLRIGWAGEWRSNAIAHGLVAAQVPPPLREIGELLEMRLQNQPPRALIRAMHIDDWEARRREEAQAKERRRQEAAAALASHPDFPTCANITERKLLLRSLGIDLDGLNQEEVVATAKRIVS